LIRRQSGIAAITISLFAQMVALTSSSTVEKTGDGFVKPALSAGANKKRRRINEQST